MKRRGLQSTDSVPWARVGHWAGLIELAPIEAAELDRILAGGEARLRIVPRKIEVIE